MARSIRVQPEPGAKRLVGALAVQPDGKILVGGAFIGGQRRNSIARLDPLTGAADSFNEHQYRFKIALQPDGKILATVLLFSSADRPAGYLSGLIRTGGWFDNPTKSFNRPPAIAVQADGKVLAGDFLRSRRTAARR